MPFSDEGRCAMVRERGPDATSSLAIFSRSVESRVSDGVQSVVTSLKKAEEKGEMLKHVKDLALRATGTFPKTFHFENPLENVFLKEDVGSWISASPRQTNDEQPLALLTASEPRENQSFATLAQSHYFLDSSKQFVVILMQLEIQSLSKSSLSSDTGEMGISIMLRPENSFSAGWELDAIEGQQEGDTIWLAARSAVTTLALAPSLDDQHLIVTARMGDGHSQFLGKFAISALIHSAFSGEMVTKNEVEHACPLFRSVYFVAEGRNIHGIHRNERNSAGLITDTHVTQTREELALFSFSVSCRTTLATCVAQLHAGTDDDANVRGTMDIRPSSLRLLDNLLILLEKETHTCREIAAREDTFGCTLPDIKHILELQYTADNCLGVMEENYLESWG